MTLVTLAIDASTYIGSIAVVAAGRVVAAGDAAMRGEREERLMPAVDRVLRDANLGLNEVGHVVCGAGPGSFTSLRIAASIAKGIAMARGIPLSAVSSLGLIVGAAGVGTGRYLAALDAMRGDSYVAMVEVDANGDVAVVSAAALMRTATLREEAARREAIVVGPGLAIDARPVASALTRLAPELIAPVDLGRWEPQYGRLAEAQVKWEATHGRPLQTH